MTETRKKQQELREIYTDAYVTQYQYHDAYRLQRLASEIQLSKQDAIVDFACGNAMLLDLLSGRFGSYTGVDFSDEFIRVCNEKKVRYPDQKIEFLCMAIEEFADRFPAQFDVGFAMDFSEHVYDEDWLTILQGMRKSLKPGAKLYLHTPNAEFFLEIMKARAWGVKQIEGHIAVRTMQANIKLLEQAGYTISSSRFLSHYNVLRILHPLSYLPLIGRWLRARLFIVAIA